MLAFREGEPSKSAAWVVAGVGAAVSRPLAPSAKHPAAALADRRARRAPMVVALAATQPAAGVAKGRPPRAMPAFVFWAFDVLPAPKLVGASSRFQEAAKVMPAAEMRSTSNHSSSNS